jgi:signal transduction histidine kinase
MSSVEYELTIGGITRWFESRMVPSGEGEVVTIVRDFTEQRRAEAEQHRLAEEQAALRRVATLIAAEAPPERVFQEVTAEACVLLDLRAALLIRYEDAQTATIVGRYGDEPPEFEFGGTLVLSEGAALRVLRTGAPVRVHYEGMDSEIARSMLAHGFSSSLAVPITVAGATWGALIAGFRDGDALAAETERRLTAFAELVATALANAQTRDELAASRLRIIEASDEERRRLERNLHDGAQQRLVSLSVALRIAQKRIRDAPEEAEELLGLAADELSEALTELRELAQGIHPAVLTERGLQTALEVLAARTPLPVSLDVELPEQLPEPVEAAAYYVVSEALANVVKHAGASSATVRVGRVNGSVHVEVRDDGAGGARLDGGSGLCGLRDRIETLAGMLGVDSAAGRGTCVRAEIPLR